MADIVPTNTNVIEYNVSFDELTKNTILQKIIVFEHYIKKKGIESLSRRYSISQLDLRYFLNSSEAYNIYTKEKDQLSALPIVDSIDELKEFLIEKTMEFLNNASSGQAVEIVEKFIPQILNIHASTKNISNEIKTDDEIQYTEFEDEKMNENYSKIQLVSNNPKIYTEEELKEIPIENNDN